MPIFPTIGDGIDPRPPAGQLHRRRRDRRAAAAALSSSALARRAGLGLARTGSVAHHGSGEIFVAFSTAASERGEAPPIRVDRRTVPDAHLDPLFAAVVEATEEAVLNALWAAVDTRAARVGSCAPCRTSRCWSCCGRTAGLR